MSGNDPASIMVVDDEDVVRTMLADMLRNLGHAVTTCVDGVEAVELYRKLWRSIDLVILDMVMPKMSGKATFRALREINPEAKVLLLSGYSVTGEAESVVDDGVKGLLQKPFRQNALTEAIASALR